MKRKISNHLLTGAIFLMIALGSTSCALNRPYPEKSSYLPDVIFENGMPVTRLPYHIKIRNTRVVAPFEGKLFVYRLPEGQWETDFYNEWFAYPRDIITETCITALVKSGQFAAVTAEDSLIEADFYLEGTLLESYLDRRNPSNPESVLKTRWMLIPNKPALKSFSANEEWSKLYENRQLLLTDTPSNYAEGTAAGLTEIMTQLATDLNEHLKPGEH